MRHFWDVFRPGGQLHPEAFLANKGHLAIEGILGLVLLGMLCARTAAPSSGKKLKAELTEQVWCLAAWMVWEAGAACGVGTPAE